jgi:hypothetical protein
MPRRDLAGRLAAAMLLSACGASTGLLDFGPSPGDDAAEHGPSDAAQEDAVEPSTDAAVDAAADVTIDSTTVDAAGDVGAAADVAVDASEASAPEAGVSDAKSDASDSGLSIDSGDAGDSGNASDAAPDAGHDGAVACTTSQPADYASWPVTDSPQGLVDNGDGTVTDNVTGLTWMQAPAGETADGGTEVDTTSLATAEASCPCPWRLPQRIELLSIVDYSRFDFALNPLFVARAVDGNTAWTATPYEPNGSQWFVDLIEGASDGEHDGPEAGQVRCVRGRAQTPAVRYTLQASDAGVPEVVDNGTGLVWKEQSEPGMYALGHTPCVAPYRLPTISELTTLVDSSTSKPAIDTAFFGDTGSDYYISATPVGYVYLAGSYWYVDFTDGSAAYNTPASEYQVRCVR